MDDDTATHGSFLPRHVPSRRMHIYHNLGNTPNVTLKEEQQSGTGGRAWWARPISTCAAPTTWRALDIDRDGDKDLVIGRTCSTEVWMNTSNPCRTTVYGQTSNNSSGAPALLSVTGVPAASVNDLQLRVSGLRPARAGSSSRAPSRPIPASPPTTACAAPAGAATATCRSGPRSSPTLPERPPRT